MITSFSRTPYFTAVAAPTLTTCLKAALEIVSGICFQACNKVYSWKVKASLVKFCFKLGKLRGLNYTIISISVSPYVYAIQFFSIFRLTVLFLVQIINTLNTTLDLRYLFIFINLWNSFLFSFSSRGAPFGCLSWSICLQLFLFSIIVPFIFLNCYLYNKLLILRVIDQLSLTLDFSCKVKKIWCNFL